MTTHIRIRLATLLSVLLMSTSSTICQKYVDHIGSEDGLSSQLCQEIIQDKYGNIWVSTFENVEKYNGYTSTSFDLKDDKNSHLPIVDIACDQAGYVWILQALNIPSSKSNFYALNYDYKITVIDPLTNEESDYESYVDSSLLDQSEIRYIQSVDNTIYLLTKDQRVFTFRESLEAYADYSDSQAITHISDKGNIYLLREDKIDVRAADGQKIATIPDSKIKEYKAFWASKTGELFFLNKTKDSIYIDEYKNQELSHSITIGTEHHKNKKLKYLEIQKFDDSYFIIQEKLYSRDSALSLDTHFSLEGRSNYDILVTPTDLVYVTTDIGIYVYDVKPKVFKHLSSYTDEQETHSVRAILVDEKIKAYKKGEKETMESPSGKLDLSFLDMQDLGTMATMHYWDSSDSSKLWSTGFINNGIREIDFDKKEVVYHEYRIRYASRSNCIYRSSLDNKLYLGGSNGLYVYENEYFYPKELNTDKTENISVNQVLEVDNQLWMATSSGLLIYDHNRDSFHIKSTGQKNYSLQYIHVDNRDEQTLWLGTRKEGLVKWDRQNDNCESYTTENGLSHNDVHAILEDSQERLWISTNRFLNCFDKKSNSISIFTEADGISHSEFNKYSFCADTTKNLFYFGGLNGYTYFCPDSINTSNSQNNIDLRIIGAQKTKNNASSENIFISVLKNNKIDFLDDDHSIKLEFTSNYLANTRNKQFTYKIPGIYDEWIKLSGNTINLNKLPYGEHKLEIISDANRPSFTSNVFTIPINVIQPFRKTWTFLGMGLLLSALLIWLGFRAYTKNIQERNIKLEKIVHERTQELSEINQKKNKLFTILAHDLRNPIGSLADISDKMKFLAANNRLHEIDILAEQTKGKINALDDNLNNILLWALSENKMISLNPEKLSLKLEIKKILDLYSTQIKEKNISNSDNLDIVDQVKIDVTALQTILRNVISNAIKYSGKGGHLRFLKTAESTDRIRLSIQDEGIGFNPKTLSSYENSTEEHSLRKGFGLGLKITGELAELSDINIKISSTPNNGTDFELDFPKV